MTVTLKPKSEIIVPKSIRRKAGMREHIPQKQCRLFGWPESAYRRVFGRPWHAALKTPVHLKLRSPLRPLATMKQMHGALHAISALGFAAAHAQLRA